MQNPTQLTMFDAQARGNWVRLRTLVMLRWMAAGGQLVTIFVATQVFGFQLPLNICALVISASVSFNVIAHIVHSSEKRLSEGGTLASLFFDLAQLVTLLTLTGGLDNPFTLLVIAPVTIAATALRLRSTLWLGGAALLSIPLLAFFRLPIILADGTLHEMPPVFRLGTAAALAIGLIFVALYARRVTAEVHAMSEALLATQLALAREQRLAAIGGIAAATAHELGTPLATIKLVAGELADELDDNPELADDVALIRSEAQRCGEILTDLSSGGRDDSQVKFAPVSAVVEEAALPHANRGKQLVIRIDGDAAPEAGEDQPMIPRTPELIHGLRNAIQNAVDYADAHVWIDADTSGETLRIAIGDDGPGFSADILPRLGEPYVSTRRRGERKAERNGYEGMGLGLFIARTLLERTGATVAFANGTDRRLRRERRPVLAPENAHPPGAIIELTWPMQSMVVSKGETRRPLGRNRRFDDENHLK